MHLRVGEGSEIHSLDDVDTRLDQEHPVHGQKGVAAARRYPLVRDGLGSAHSDLSVQQPGRRGFVRPRNAMGMAEKAFRIGPVLCPAGSYEGHIPFPAFDSLEPCRRFEIRTCDGFARGQAIDASQSRDVEHDAPGRGDRNLLDPVGLEPTAFLGFVGVHAPMEVAIVGDVAQGVDMRPGVTPDHDHFARRRSAVGPNHVAVPALQTRESTMSANSPAERSDLFPKITDEGLEALPEAETLLREAVADWIPAAVLRRKDKKGFPVPLTPWLKGPLRDWSRDLLMGKKAVERGLYSMDAVSRILDNEREFGRKAWGLINLELWFQQFGDAL